MNPGWKEKILGYATRQHLRELALAVFWISLGTVVWSVLMAHMWATPPVQDETVIPEDTTTASTLTAPESEPVTLRIPSIGVTAQFEAPLDIAPDGSVGVPNAFDTVGWYKHSPTPGEMGPAIILGHVDSYKGPAIFWSLGQLNKGDTVEIDRADGSTAIFSVTGYERVEQTEFPTERVYGNISYAGIRLITCSGTYDKQTLRYDRNLIVYGELTGVRYPEKTQ